LGVGSYEDIQMNPQEKLRERAKTLAGTFLTPQMIGYLDVNLIEQALIETRNQALEEAIEKLEDMGVPYYTDDIRSLKTGEGK